MFLYGGIYSIEVRKYHAKSKKIIRFGAQRGYLFDHQPDLEEKLLKNRPTCLQPISVYSGLNCKGFLH